MTKKQLKTMVIKFYRTKYLTAVFIVLFWIVACHTPDFRPATDEELQMLLEKSKNYSETFPDSALMILGELLPQQQGDEKKTNLAWVLNCIGVAYDTKGMYDSAAYHLYEASRIAEEIKDDSLLISIYTNLGILQFEMNNADEAIKYHQQALAIGRNKNFLKSIASSLNNIGNTYMTLLHDSEKAIPYFEQCMEFSAKTNNATAYKVAGINLADIYCELNELDKALYEINRLTEQYGPNIYAENILGNIYFKKGDRREAIQTYQNLLKKQLNTREFEFTILKNIAEVYRDGGNLDSTVVYLEKSYALRDSLHNRQTTETIQNLKIAYETEKKELTITALEDENQLLLWLGITSVAMLLVGLTALFFLWRWTVQKKRLSEQQIKQFEQEKQLIATQAVLDGETSERTRIARDLHDGLGGMLSVVRLNLDEMKENVKNGQNELIRFNRVIGLLDNSIEEMRRVAHHLMPDTLSRSGLKTALTDFLNVVPNVEFNFFGEAKRIDHKLEVIVYRIIHELVSNALKHASASHILVQVIQETGGIALTVEDNGCGFNPEVIMNGAGIRNIRSRVASFGGMFDLRSEAGKGTEINVKFQN